MQISIWERESFFAPQDIIIAGSGFTGLWSAFFLKKKNPRLKITILDRGLIPSGASTRNAGFACFGSLGELVRDTQLMGTDQMLQLVEARFKGLERIRKYFDDSLVDFDFSGGYELYDNADQISAEQLQKNIEYINSLLKPVTGKKNTYRMADEEISNFGFGNVRHLVKNSLEGVLHSGKLVQALLQKVQGMGVQVLTGVDIKYFERTGERLQLFTNHPVDFFTDKLLICTNAFAKELLPDTDIVPARGQIILTSPIPDLPWKGSFHSDEGFYYFRNLGSKVLLGGARNTSIQEEETTDMDISEQIQQKLEQYLDEVVLPSFRGQYSIEHRWSGIMAMGSGKMPIVKEVQPGVYCAVRMSGMGVALAPVVAQEVASMIRENL